MNLSNLLWLHLIPMTLQPIIAQKWLEASRMRLLGKLEKSRNSRVIALVHHQETMNFLGFPIIRTYVREILRDKLSDEKAVELVEMLATGTWTHDFPLTYEVVKELGLPVTTALPEDVCRFMGLFPQPKQRVPSVHDVPVPIPARQREGQPT